MPQLQTLMTGLVFGESPRWRDDRLWLAGAPAATTRIADRC